MDLQTELQVKMVNMQGLEGASPLVKFQPKTSTGREKTQIWEVQVDPGQHTQMGGHQQQPPGGGYSLQPYQAHHITTIQQHMCSSNTALHVQEYVSNNECHCLTHLPVPSSWECMSNNG